MCSRGLKRLFKIDLGLSRYKDAWGIQKKLLDLRYRNRIPDSIVLTEHEPVITMGRATSKTNLLISETDLVARGIDLFEIERGGDITFHGPGQLVAYPIIELTARGRDLHQYLRDLENLIIVTLDDFGLKAGVRSGLTGVWVGKHKVAAIGVAVSRWISYHGLALNVNTDMDYFKLINPCGITEYPVGSVSQLLGKEIDFESVKNILAENFARLFYYEMETIGDLDSVFAENETVPDD